MTDHNYADNTWLQPPATPGSLIGRVMTFGAFMFAAALGYIVVIAILSLA